ncbi:hypothetical protein [Candidatus Villigracilis saccharophilus]|uniref:hypothetical protein n=1 Tax=Candidatus Villigracilis saccharophilus TaxID=3140684 RepID=UPI003134895C|nr:hypothetical protein [Anaerolineales bacterium]
MAHGGIRYLENGEFRLVREAVRERNRMIRTRRILSARCRRRSPYLNIFRDAKRSLKFLGWLDKPSERGSIIIKLGLIMYDAYMGKNRTMPRHTVLSRGSSLSKWKHSNPEIVNTATYYDGLISDPERLALEIVLDAESETPNARALNYVSMVNGEKNTVILRDELTDETFEVHPKLVINAAIRGSILQTTIFGLSTRYVGGTKGSHLVVDNPELRCNWRE